MNVTFVELGQFTRLRPVYFSDDDHFREFQNGLLDNPRLGPVVPGCGGIRKIRWPDSRRGKGKRGGLRILYYVLDEAAIILLLAVYDKNIEDLPPAQRDVLAEVAQTFKQEALLRLEEHS